MPADREPPVRRADATRNRAAILSAARGAFAEQESVSMAEVARRAGVGMATLYRNFPNRLELLAALYTAEADQALAEPTGDDRDAPDVALRAWLERFYGFATGKKHIGAELLTYITGDSPIFSDTRDRIVAAGRPLFDAARAANLVRPDVSFDQILRLLVAVTGIEGDPDERRPLLDLVLDGIFSRSRDT